MYILYLVIKNLSKKEKKNMKKAKIITISLLGLLLLVPFLGPARAATSDYTDVAVEEKYEWTLSQYNANFAQWDLDKMDDWLATVFLQPVAFNFTTIRAGWSWDSVTPQSSWPMTVRTILPENTSAFLSDYFILDEITHTPVLMDGGFTVIHFPSSSSYYSDTWYIVNDSASFAAQSLYGGSATSPYMIMGVPFGPKNIDWSVFAGWANWGMGGYWVGLAANTIVTALADGYSMSVPAMGYGNNSLPITINVTYTAAGILDTYTFEYGALTLFLYELDSYEADVVDPVITATSTDFSVEHDYTGETIAWTATDANPDTYTVTRNGTTVGSATAWTSGTEVEFNVPDGLDAGDHVFEITFTDDEGNSVTSDMVVMTVGAAPAAAIPGYELPIVLGVFTIGTIGIIIFIKKKK